MGVTIHQAQAIDASAYTEEENFEFRKQDTESRWQDVPEKHIEECPAALSYLNEQSFIYYIPAYMTWTVKKFRESDSFTADAAIYALARLESFQSDLTEEQRHAICLFLRYCVQYAHRYLDSDAAQKALDKYWGQFCTQ